VYNDTCTHFCQVTRRITMLPPHSSVISQSFHQKMNVLKVDSDGTLKCSEKEGGAVDLAGYQWDTDHTSCQRTLSYYLDCVCYTVRTGSICDHSIINWQDMVLFWCLSFTVWLIVTLFSSRLQIMVRIELLGILSTRSLRPLPFVLYVPFCYVRSLSVAQLWVKLRTVETWY
jgi:hypothetical protein